MITNAAPCLFTIDDDPTTYTAVELLRDNDGFPDIADLIFDLTEKPVGTAVVYGGGASGEFTITRVR
jgi:hypothetical protein